MSQIIPEVRLRNLYRKKYIKFAGKCEERVTIMEGRLKGPKHWGYFSPAEELSYTRKR